MKTDLKLLLIAIAALGIPAAAHAETLTQAQITKIVKDVKTIEPAKGAREAVLKETLQGEQSVKTGIESRTELLFNDKTITRLGANTHFSFSEGTRNMSLQSGVMLLQVPKNIGGAKIETAAVTAAVTGTTIMIEAGKDYTKLIVLEGECCLTPKTTKKGGKLLKLKRKVCATAGQEIILRNGEEAAEPVYVNLKLLEATSLLLTGSWGADINHGPVDAAADDQKPKDFIPTNLAIIGAGTDVTVITSHLPPPSAPPADGPPGKYGPLTTIVTPNPYIINNTTTIVTDPIITTNGVAAYGKIYRGAAFDGPASNYLFGFSDALLNATFGIHNGQFPAGGVAVFKFGNLLIGGVPTIVTDGGPIDLALIAEGGISFVSNSEDTLDLDLSGLNSLTLATEFGTIDLGEGFSVSGVGEYLSLYSGKNIIVNSDLVLGAIPAFSALVIENEGPNSPDLLINAGGFLTIGSTTENTLTFGNGIWYAAGGMAIGGHIHADDALTLTSLGDITLGSQLGGETGSSINAFSVTVNGKNINLLGNGYIDAYEVTLNAKNTVNVDGSIYASYFEANTTSGTGPLPENGIDFNGNGYISAYTITVNSRGFLEVSQSYDEEIGYSDFLNDMEFDHDNIETLNLTGDKIIVNDYYNHGYSEGPGMTMNLTSNFSSNEDSGNIIIQGDVDVSHFNAVAAGTIYGNSVDDNSPSVHAQTIHITVGTDATLGQDGDAYLDTEVAPENNVSLTLVLADYITPTYDLNLTTAGSITVSTPFSDAHDSGLSEQGYTYLTLSLTANDNADFQPGNINIQEAINVYSFVGTASGEIRDTDNGSITATYTTLNVGVDATLINSTVDLGSGNFATNTTVYYNDENSIKIILDDEGNITQSLSLTGNNVTVGDTESNPGFFAPDLDLTLNANYGTVTVNGSVETLVFNSYAAQGFAGTGDVTAQTVSLQTGVDATLTNTVTFVGSALVTTTTFGPDGGTLHVILDSSDNKTTSFLAASSGKLTLATDFSAPYLTTLSLNGYGSTELNGDIDVNGANAIGTEDAGGDGGTVNINSYGDINANKAIIATTGLNGTNVTHGGTGGTVNFDAYGTINIKDKIEVSSSAGQGKSASGGNINVKSHKATGTAINIANTAQLSSLLDAAAPGAGGTITFLADGGGNVAVSGTVRADKGTVNITATGTNATVALNGATLSGDVVKVAALGNNGTLSIGGGSINGDTAIKLYAAGSNGTVNFIGNTSLTGASVKTIAGNTVNVFNGVTVNVSGPAATVFTNNPNYTGSGGNGTRTGQFTGSGATTQPFANKPAF